MRRTTTRINKFPSLSHRLSLLTKYPNIMKHFKCALGALAFASLMVLNFAQSENRLLLDSLASGSSSQSSGSGSSSGSQNSGSTSDSSDSSQETSNPCCNKWKFWASCNQKKTVSEVKLECTTVTTIYYSAQGKAQTEIVKYGVVTQSVSADFKAKATKQESSTTSFELDTKAITCPTSGDCNNCEEYRPSCEEGEA